QQIVGVGVRLVALWFLYAGTSQFIQWLMLSNASWATEVRESGRVPTLVTVSAYLIAAAFCWLAPMWIAHKLLPKTSHENVLEIHRFDAARVGCALLGLWFLVHAVYGIFWFFISAMVATGSASFISGVLPEHRINFFTDIVQGAMALVLILKSAAFARFVARG
ncbi:MAG: hypothetical protein JNJ55_06610, partial [Betaproteobacteria bacterium]|nr:hypothetical protein [Betaproteobacteria bacterium]